MLRAALRAGLGFPYECNSGSCGTCRFEVRSGAFAMAWPDAPALSERDRRRGRLLGCQATPAQDATIAVRLDNAYAPPVTPMRAPAHLAAIRPLTHDMSEFEFHRRAGARFLPGQYALLSLPGVEGSRAYSMSNLSNVEGAWRFVVKRKPDGAGSRALFDRLVTGDTVMLDGPFGLAYLRDGGRRAIVCIAGGSGLSPMLSIVRGAMSRPPAACTAVHLFYGARRPEDAFALASLANFGPDSSDVDFKLALSAANDLSAGAWPGLRGLIHDVVEREAAGLLAEAEVYFAGPPAMTRATHEMLIRRQVPPERIHFDSFY